MGIDGQHARRAMLDELSHGGAPSARSSASPCSGPALGRRIGLEEAELAGEVARLLETLVDAREAHRGDVVECPQTLEHGKSQLLAGDLSAGCSSHFLHFTGQSLDRIGFNGPVLTSRPDAAHHLAALEGFPLPGALHHDDGLGRPFVCCEAPRAAGALPPAPDGRAMLDLSRVDDTIFDSPAPRAPHHTDGSARQVVGSSTGLREDDPLAGEERCTVKLLLQPVDQRSRVAARLHP
jgi:hypothetical protein